MSNISTVNLSEFLYKNKHESSSSDVITHTRIGNKSEGIYGGSYTIVDDNVKLLHNYMVDVVLKNKNEYLTETQMDIGPIAIDYDFRYDKSVSTRQHTKEDITSILCMYSDIIRKIFDFKNKDSINAFVFEKPNVNICDKETKDGIHIILV